MSCETPLSHRVSFGVVATIISVLFPLVTHAGSFSDVPDDHPAAEAIEHLKTSGIIGGYSDGTFHPDELVNRAAALKLIVSSVTRDGDLDGVADSSVYSDVPKGSWYLPYVEYARVTLKLIDGPPKRPQFKGSDPVTKSEFLKMFLLARKVDPVAAYSEVKDPLAIDVQNADEWFFPYIRYAITTSMTQISQQDMLNPNKSLTRGEVAMLMDRYFQYVDHRRIQYLLAEVDDEVASVITYLQKGEHTRAGFAATRATLAARGALASRPDEPLVKGAVKTAEAYGLIVEAYRAAVNGDYDKTIQKTKQAWELGEKVREFSDTLEMQAQQIQLVSSDIANQARDRKQ